MRNTAQNGNGDGFLTFYDNILHKREISATWDSAPRISIRVPFISCLSALGRVQILLTDKSFIIEVGNSVGTYIVLGKMFGKADTSGSSFLLCALGHDSEFRRVV